MVLHWQQKQQANSENKTKTFVFSLKLQGGGCFADVVTR